MRSMPHMGRPEERTPWKPTWPLLDLSMLVLTVLFPPLQVTIIHQLVSLLPKLFNHLYYEGWDAINITFTKLSCYFDVGNHCSLLLRRFCVSMSTRCSYTIHFYLLNFSLKASMVWHTDLHHLHIMHNVT